MRRRGVCACCLGVALALDAGCAGFRKARRDDASPAVLARRQELSESAQAAIDRHDLGQARGLLDQLVSESPRSAEAHQRRARVLQLEGALDAAAAEYREALKIDRDYVDALLGLGQILHQLGHEEVALKRFAQAIEIDPNKAEAHFAEGQTYESLGRKTEALASYFRALEIDPTSAETILRVALLQLERNQPDQVLARLDQMLQLAPKNAEGRHLRGLAHLALKRPDAAIDDLRAASASLPDRADVFYHLAEALAAARKTPEALAAAENALKLNPAYADARALSDRLKR
jgi:tetratricopeptide (TPR) repeat protein